MVRNFLFVLWAGGGNVVPQLVVARNLAARGHTVRVLAPAALRERIERAGLTFEAYTRAPEHDESDPATSLIRDFEAKTPAGAIAAARTRLFVGTAAALAADTHDAITQWAPDLVVYDYMLMGAGFGAEMAGVASVPLIHHVSPLPAPGVPPFGMGWPPAKGSLGRARDRVGYAMFAMAFTRPLLKPLNDVRRDLGLPPLRSALDAITEHPRVLVLTSASFDFAGARPHNMVYVGPQLPDEMHAAEWATPERTGVPLVLVAFSTTYQKQADVLARVVRGLGELPIRVLVGTGPASLPQPLPANVEAHRYVPHERVMASADAVVTHAGHSTVMAALAAGVPLVCLPMGRDQPDVAARVVHAGAGVRLSPRSSAEKIAAATQRVVSMRSYRDAARRLQLALADDVARNRAVTELEAAAGVPQADNLQIS